MRRFYQQWLVFVCLLIGANVASADSRLFDVEVIIFQQTHADLAEERWPMTWQPASFPRYAELASSGSPDNARFTQLSADQLRLGQTARRLDNQDRYRVLLHAGWRQPGLSQTTAPAVNIPLGGAPSSPTPALGGTDDEDNGLASARPLPGLSGYLRVYVERFLHIESNLRLVDPSLRLAGRVDHLPLFDSVQSPVVVMQERRRMRSGETHYLDHPVLGVIVRIERAD